MTTNSLPVGTSSMDAIRISRTALLEKLKTNLEEHKKDFLEAKENYQAKTLAELKKLTAKAKKGEIVPQYLDLQPPVEFIKDYNRAIAMLGATTDEFLILSQREFGQYWMDEWTWSQTFSASNATYSERVRTKSLSI